MLDQAGIRLKSLLFFPMFALITSIRSVNSVDVLYASFPVYLYLNPAIIGYLLRPLLLAQDTSEYTQPYAAQNLGL